MQTYDLRDRQDDYHLYLKGNNKAEIHTLAPIYIEPGDKLYVRDDEGNVWIAIVNKTYDYKDGCGDMYAHLSLGGREATYEEWDKAMDYVMNTWDWDWSKHYPKRDTDSWKQLTEQFISDYHDMMSNYNEEDGIPGSRNSDELMEFFELCVKYPDLRFFQALSIMIKRSIYVMDDNPDSTPGMKLPGQLHDTFGWEKESYERRS